MGFFKWLFRKTQTVEVSAPAHRLPIPDATDRPLNEEEAFIIAILGNPGDLVNHLVYADWLEDRGDTTAEYVRCAAASAPPAQWYQMVPFDAGRPSTAQVAAVLKLLKILGKVIPYMSAYEFPDLEERLIRDRVCSGNAEYRELFRELKRFLALCFISGQGFQMTSRKIDAVWHQFILFTKEYSHFCEEAFGRYMHHSPYTGAAPLGDNSAAFARLYVQVFGVCPPSVWVEPSDTSTPQVPNASPHEEGPEDEHGEWRRCKTCTCCRCDNS